MLRPRTQYRIGSAVFLMVLMFVAFFGAYSGTFSRPVRHGEVPQQDSRAAAADQDDQTKTALNPSGDVQGQGGEAVAAQHDDDPASERAVRDLAAQESMAETARWQVWIGLLALAGLAVTIYYTHQTAKAAIRGTEVAEAALTGLERPYLFVENFEMTPISREWIDESVTHRPIEFTCDILNYGRSPAIIRETRCQIYIGSELPTVPVYNPAEVSNAEIVIAPGDRQGLFKFYRGKVSAELIGQLFASRTYIPNQPRTIMIFYGSVTYESVYGAVEEFGFCFEHLVDICEFVPYESAPNYTYRKRLHDPRH